MPHKPRFLICILSLLVGIGVLFGSFMLLASVQQPAVAASAQWYTSTESNPMSPNAPPLPCTNSGCHGSMEFGATSHHVASNVSEADCQVCHAEVNDTANHQNGSVQLLDPDQAGIIYTVPKFGGQRSTLTAADIVSMTTFCYNCHDGDGAARLGTSAHDPFGDGVTQTLAIGTHSNVNFSGVEADFQVGCIQCHASHGSSNLALIDSDIVVAPGIAVGPVTFTSDIGANSRDDGTGSGICVICHTDSSNPGYPMTNHSGGLHTGWAGDQRGNDCTECHSHEPDSNPASLNGHMPADTNAVGLQGILVQSRLWPVLGFVGVLLTLVVERRKRSRN